MRESWRPASLEDNPFSINKAFACPKLDPIGRQPKIDPTEISLTRLLIGLKQFLKS